jgi:hypothetical protein
VPQLLVELLQLLEEFLRVIMGLPFLLSAE